MLEPPFNKVADLKACNFLKKSLGWRFPVKFKNYLRKPF